MEIINEIIAKDKMLGDLARESKECASNNKYMAALACLFILVEQAVKQALDRTEGDFAKLSLLAKKQRLVTNDEFMVLKRLRECRNKLFHESHYSWFLEKDGIVYPFSEDETKKLIYDDLSNLCFNIVLKLCN